MGQAGELTKEHLAALRPAQPQGWRGWWGIAIGDDRYIDYQDTTGRSYGGEPPSDAQLAAIPTLTRKSDPAYVRLNGREGELAKFRTAQDAQAAIKLLRDGKPLAEALKLKSHKSSKREPRVVDKAAATK